MYRKYYYGRTRTWTRDYDVIMTSYVWPHDDDVILPVSRRHLLRIFCTRRSHTSFTDGKSTLLAFMVSPSGDTCIVNKTIS